MHFSCMFSVNICMGIKPVVHGARLPGLSLLSVTAADNKYSWKEYRKQSNTSFTSHPCPSIHHWLSQKLCLSAVTLPFMSQSHTWKNFNITVLLASSASHGNEPKNDTVNSPTRHSLGKGCLSSIYCSPSLCSAFHLFYILNTREKEWGEGDHNYLHCLKCSHPVDLYSNIISYFLFLSLGSPDPLSKYYSALSQLLAQGCPRWF